MQKICAIILLTALVSNYEALPQTKWSRQLRNPQGQLIRERRQFPFGEWIPLSQPCPTCRPFADPLDSGLKLDSIGLTPPRPPTVTRQIHGEGNFFQDESSILSVPPPPPSTIPRHPIGTSNGNFQNLQFNSFTQQFNNPLTVPTQQIFPQTQQIQFLPQTFLPNQQTLLVNNNQQILPVLSTQNTLFGQDNQAKQQQIANGKVPKFNSEFKQQKPAENVLLEQNKRPAQPTPRPFTESPFRNKPSPFTAPPQQQQQQTQSQQQVFKQQNQQQQGFVQKQQQQQQGLFQQQQQRFIQQQPLIQQQQQQQHSVNFGDSILTPPPVPNATAQNIVIPGLDKEEIQLLYVPVETLRQRGNFQEQLLAQQPQNIQFHNRPSPSPSPVSPQLNQQPTTKQQSKGHFVTQEGNNNREQSISTLKVTPAQPFPTTVTPSTLLLQNIPFQQTPQPFVSATPITPATPTIQPFVTSSAPSKFSSFTPETTLSHLSTIPNAIQFSQPGLEFGTTAKSIFQDEIINGKSQFSNFKEPAFQGVQFQQPQVALQQQQQQQPFVNQQQSERPPQQSTVFLQQGQQQNAISKQQLQEQQQALIQKQQLLQQQKEKELQQKYLLERQQKEAEAQRLLAQQRQKELEEQRILQQQQQQRQKELEEQRLLQQQRQKELEEQRLLQQQRQKELEQQRYLQELKQKELEEQRFLQQQRQRELENQRQLQLQRQKELEEKRRLQLQKQREQEEQQRLLRLQQQQKELEEQRLLQQQQEQQRLLQQQALQKQNQENLKKQQQYQFIQQQQQQQKLQQPQQEALQQPNRHTLPVNDKLNSIAQLAKESEPDDAQLVPHQPPLSVFFRGYEGAQPRIVDVLRELRTSKTITVLDQYFEKMPKVFVGPAGLIPPTGYGKFELPYLSNLETNRIERKIDRLPFFVAPLNFIPPPGYSKIPFPAPHVGSVVISSETNPAMKLLPSERENNVGSTEENNDSGSYPVVGPEVPGLVNSLETETTTFKPTVFSSTPSLPQTTAQLRNRRPNTSLYRTQNRKPLSKTRLQTTTSKPEEEVTQPAPKSDSESGIRKPFNRFLKRRRPQAKTTTESSVTNDQEGKNLENRFYSVEVYHKQKNGNTPRHDQFQEKQSGEPNQFEHQGSNIDRTTPEGQNVYDIQPTPGFYKTGPTGSATESNERRPQILDYSGVNNLQTYEDGPFPTGSAKTITHELYRPNALRPAIPQHQQQYDDSASSKFQPKPDTSLGLEKHHEVPESPKLVDISDVNPTAAFVGTTGQKSTVAQDAVKIQPTAETGFERQDITLGTSDKYYENEGTYTPGSVTAPEEQKSTSFVGSDEQYTSAFAEISKHHHIPSPADSSKKQQTQFSSEPQSSPEIAQHLQAPFSEQHFTQEQHSQEFGTIDQANARPTPNTADPQFSSVGPSNEQYPTNYAAVSNNEQTSGFANTAHGQVNPTASGASQEQYTTGFAVNSNSQNPQVENTEDLRRPSFINFQNVQGTPEPTEKPNVQYYPSSTQGQRQEYEAVTETVKNYDYPKVVEQNYVPVTPETLPVVSEAPTTQSYQQESVSEDLTQINDQKQTSEGQGQNIDDNLSNTHRLKIPNPSIVKVRTRVRGKSRGQLNFAASQTTTQAPYTRSRVENKNVDNTEQEYATKTNSYQPVKISKFNQYRGLKKPVRPTTEAATENEQKVNVYTIRPQRRPSNPSTVSTKRIRRPTTPVPTVESSGDGISIATPGTQAQAEESEFSPSGVSNDVYYEHSSFSPIRNKYRKHFGAPEEKSDVVPSYTAAAYPSTIRPHFSTVQDHSNEEVNVIKDFTHTLRQENYDKYPEWNPAESGIDVSGIVLTTTGAPVTHDDQLEVEEPKKTQDSKKAFDPDLEKKSGRRRVRVRVHKRPHENFETAESQNLRTVANVLVPPTSTYKPSDESNLHQLVKNSDYSFGGQKSFGIRSREYFRKRLNLTQTERNEVKQETIDDTEEGNSERRQTIKTQTDSQDEVPVTAGGNAGESLPGTKVRGYVRKIHKSQKKENESVSNQSSEDNSSGNTGNKHGRTKFRGYVRKIIKHGDAGRDNGNDSNQSAESGEIEAKQDNIEHHTRQHFRGNHGGFNQTGRVNGTRHRTFVRYVKKNKIRTQETESRQEPEVQQREEQTIHQTTETLTEQPKIQLTEVSESQTESQQTKEQEISQTQYPVYHGTEQPENNKQTEDSEASQTLKPVSTSEKELETEQTEQPESRQTPEVIRQTTQEPETDRTLPQQSQETEESEVQQTQPTEAPKTQETVQQYTQRTKYYQTLRPISQRTQYTGFHRTTENHISTTERITQEFQEKRDGPIRPKYGKTAGYGSESKSEDSKRTNEQNFDQQNRNKNSHIFEIRKYLRTKNREGAFSQFSKNRYFTSEKTETVETSKEDSREDKSSEEITTPVETTPIESEPRTTNTFAPNTDSVEVQSETTKNDEGIQTKFTTEEIETSTELAKHEDDAKDITVPVQPESTTEGKTDLPTTLYQTSDRNDQITESKTEITVPTERNEISQTEIQPDLYRFSKSSFSFDETEKFTGTKNRAHVRNITADIIENTASFSAPGIDKHSDSNLVVPTTSNGNTETITESHSDVSTHEKTEEGATEYNSVDATTEYPDNTETESTAATEAVTKAKIAKLIKTSTTTKVSHETEICYKGKCIRTKSENPDEDLKLLVDSASTMKIEKPKT